MSNRLEQSLIKLLKNEGGYVDDPVDRGGKTKYGISQKSYPNLVIRNLTKEDAYEIYKRDYWHEYYNLIDNKDVAFLIFDMGVNMGVRSAVKVLQTCINEVNHVDLVVDGYFGENTLRMLGLREFTGNIHKPLIAYYKVRFAEIVRRDYKDGMAEMTKEEKQIVGKLGFIKYLNGSFNRIE